MPKISVVIPVYNLENYIEDMLESVKKQSFRDFEAILVDDGSIDDSISIAKRVIGDDSRFRLIQQENQGVSKARNNGMDSAEGEYIIFFDGDDYIPPESLQHLYESITANDCQMTVGIMKTYNDGEYTMNAPTKALASRQVIKPSDINFIKTWSQCNKMYKLSFLRENNIRFIDAKVAEDGHFLYQVLAKAKNISGCDHEVYHYIRRPFWSGEYTASKNVNERYLTDRLTVYNDMLIYLEEVLEGISQEEADKYTDELLTRFIKGGIVQAFFKRIWRCDDSIYPKLLAALRYYKEKVSPECWSEITGSEWEIGLERCLTEAEDRSFKTYVCEEPELTVIIPDGMTEDELNLTVYGLYNQEFPAFEILMRETVFGTLSDDNKKKQNIRTADATDMNGLVDNAKGKYVCILDRMAVLHTHAFKKMINKLRNDLKLDFVSGRIKGFDHKDPENMYNNLRTMEAVFGYKQAGRFGRTPVNYLDNLLMNKVFRAGSIKGLDWSADDADLIREMYNNMNFEKYRAECFFSSISDDEVWVRSQGHVSKINFFKKYIQNRMVAALLKFRR